MAEMVRVRMRRCSKRECVEKWLRIVNVIVNVWGVAMIIYSLCLHELWLAAVSRLPPASQLALPRPWFIFTCLIVGIVVCLSTLWGHMVTNCVTRWTLSIYVASLSTLLLLQGIVITVIFFKLDLGSQINNLIDNKHHRFSKYAIFHLRMCRVVSILAFVAQMSIAVLAGMLWMSYETMENEGVGDSDAWEAPDLRNSFLVYPYSSLALKNHENRRHS